jgi:hypothetical protein
MYDDTAATAHALTLCNSGLLLDADRDRLVEAIDACLTGERCAVWLEEATPSTLVRVTLTLRLWYAGEVRKVRTYEFPPREGEDTVLFGHRVLATMAEIVTPYLDRVNLVTFAVDAYTQAELDIIDAAYETF